MSDSNSPNNQNDNEYGMTFSKTLRDINSFVPSSNHNREIVNLDHRLSILDKKNEDSENNKIKHLETKS